MALKVGDRVRAKNNIFADEPVPSSGTIVWLDDRYCDGTDATSDNMVDASGLMAGVEFDEDFGGGHTLNGHIDSERGRYGNPDELELLEYKLDEDGNYW